MERRVVLLNVLWAHLAFAILHGITHIMIPVDLFLWQYTFVLITTVLGPIVGIRLAWRDHPVGLPLFTLAMTGALVFGLYHHFLVTNPDHVHVVPGGIWQMPFQVTALGVAITDAIGMVIGAWYWRNQ